MKYKVQLTIMFLVIFTGIFNASFAMKEPETSNPKNLTGRVSDSNSKQPMEYVTVVVYKTADSSMVAGTITGKEGDFSISMPDSGRFFVEVSFIGFEKKKIEPVTITNNQNRVNLGEIGLEPVTTDITEVLVSGTRSAIEYKVDKRVVNVDKNINAQGGSAIQALENTPSVQLDARGNLTLRGSSDYLVLVDGKPSVLKGSDALRQLPANTIKQIEVITNPSAKYDSDGNAGIINVILKKEKMQGVNGTFNVSPGTPDLFTTSSLLNYRKGKINVFAGFDFADRMYHNSIDINNNSFLPSGNLHIEEIVKERYCHDNTTGKAGFDIYFNEKNSFSLTGSLSRQGYDKGTDSKYMISQNDTADYFTSSNYMDVSGDVYRFTADFTHNFGEDHVLSVSSYFGSWDGLDENNLAEINTGSSYNFQSLKSKLNFKKYNSNYNSRSNIDYSVPIKKVKMETGGQVRYENRDEDLVFTNFDTQNQKWVLNSNYSYVQDYKNTIISGYLIFSGAFKSVSYQAGVRSEYFTRTIKIDKEEDAHDFTKFMVYPSVHLSKNIKDKHLFQANYSRRINRPEPFVLNNTPVYVDPNNIFMGSPNLKFEYSDNFELNYRSTFNKITVSTQTYFRNTSNSFTSLRLMGDDGIMIHQLTNANNQTAFGIEQELNVNLKKWWTVNANANVYSYTLKAYVINAEQTRKVNSWECRLVTNMNFKTKTRFQATGYYRAKTIDAMGETSGFFNLTTALNQQLFKGKMNIGVTAQNLLNSVVFDYTTKTDKFDNKYKIRNDGPIFVANLSYNFNNYQNKKRGRDDAASFKGGSAF